MERRYWSLLAVAAAQGKPLTPVQLQKSLFLFGKLSKEKPENFYNFTPYNYGPFDSTIYHDAGKLSEEGLIVVRQAPGQRWNEYVATAPGLTRAADLEKRMPLGSAKFLKSVVGWTRQFDFQQLVQRIYKAFPETRKHSVLRS